MALSDKDVDAEMAKDWATITEKYAAPEPEVEPIDDAPDDKPVSRAPDGKFKAAEPEQPIPEKSEKPEKIASSTMPETSEPEVPGRDINRAPSSWKPLARAEWEKLSPALKAEIHRREADFQNGQSQLLPDAQLGKGLREIIRPYEAMIQAEGGTPERAVADLFRTAAIFRTGTQAQKLRAIAVVADQFQVDLNPLFNALQAQKTGQPIQQPQSLRDPRVDQLLAQQEQERRAAAERETRELDSTVTQWIGEVDAQGNPKRPYLNDVINEMMPLVTHFKQANPGISHQEALNRAYDSATWAHPEVRQLLTKAQQTDLELKRRSENQRRVQEAKRAGSVNTPRRASTPTPGKPGTMEDTIRETARELGLV